MKNWLRWICVLPGSIAVTVLSHFPVHWALVLCQYWSNRDPTISVGNKGVIGSIPIQTLEPHVMAFVAPFILVYSAAWIAPRFKFQTGIVVAVLISGYLLLVSSFGLQGVKFSYTPLLATLQALGFISALAVLHSENKKRLEAQEI